MPSGQNQDLTLVSGGQHPDFRPPWPDFLLRYFGLQEALLWFCVIIGSDSLGIPLSTHHLPLHLSYCTTPEGTPTCLELFTPSSLALKESALASWAPPSIPTSQPHTLLPRQWQMPQGHWHLLGGAEIFLHPSCHICLLLPTISFRLLIEKLLISSEPRTFSTSGWGRCASKAGNQALPFPRRLPLPGTKAIWARVPSDGGCHSQWDLTCRKNAFPFSVWLPNLDSGKGWRICFSCKA